MVNPGSPVFLFIGDDGCLKEKALARIRSSILDNSSIEFDYKVFYGRESEARDILDYLTTIPFQAAKRLAVVKEFEKFPQEERARLAAYIKKPSKTACLVIEADDDRFLEECGDAVGNIRVERFGNLTGYELVSRIKKSFADAGKNIAPEALKELADFGGGQMAYLTQEIEKLITFTGARKDITLNDVEEVTGKSIERSAFELTDAVTKNDVNEALSITRDLLLGGKRHHEIIGLLCWHFKKLLKAKMLQEKGVSDSMMMGALKINRRHSEDFFRQLKSLSGSQVRSKVGLLLETDIDIKTTKYEPALALEFAIIRLCLT